MMRPPVVACQGADWSPVNPIRGTGSGTCGACGKPLAGKLTWFCRAPAWCRDLYMSNHDWGYARAIALRRSSPTGYKRDARCSRCDLTPEESNLRAETEARYIGNVGRSLEVNHIEPREGRGYALGCHHHQDNLEVLCHVDHLEVTAEQRRQRATA